LVIQTCQHEHIRIIIDIVPNHCSHLHPWFTDAKKHRAGKFRKWFYFKDRSNEYLTFMGFRELPKLNLENPDTAEWMINNFVYWAKLGIDGFRIDHVLGILDNFLVKLRQKLHEHNPDFVLLGEAWGEGLKYKYLKTLRKKGRYALWKNGFKQVDIQKSYAGIIDGVLDFGWRNILLNNINLIKKNPIAFNKLSDDYTSQFPRNLELPRFLDNHDTSRIMHLCNNDRELFKQLLKILFEQEQAIILYYGTESGLTHKRSVDVDIPYSDLDARGIINWDLQKQEYQEYIKELAMQR
jgi:cyclomaltodextrinase / maltogenic alpha-amylase / neopullulanase